MPEINDFPLYLASGSPRRAALLAQIGVRFRRLAVEVDESPQAGESPGTLAMRLALAKARAGLAVPARTRPRPVLGADTLVALGEEVLGKPCDRGHALEMLARLSGREHQVYSAVALCRAERDPGTDGPGDLVRLSVSEVRFGPVDEAQRLAYWASGEPRDKAGAYAIQGLGALFVAELRGSYSGVMGLPLYETAGLLREAGIPVLTGAKW